jgi:hypothetical protein
VDGSLSTGLLKNAPSQRWVSDDGRLSSGLWLCLNERWVSDGGRRSSGWS